MLLPKVTMAVAFFIDGTLVYESVSAHDALAAHASAAAESIAQWVTAQQSVATCPLLS